METKKEVNFSIDALTCVIKYEVALPFFVPWLVNRTS